MFRHVGVGTHTMHNLVGEGRENNNARGLHISVCTKKKLESIRHFPLSGQ